MLRNKVLTLCLLLIAAAGCKTPMQRIDEASLPQIVGVRFNDLTAKDVTLVFDLQLTNPFDTDLEVGQAEYNLSTSGKSFLSGQTSALGVVRPHTTRTLRLPVQLDFAKIVGVLSAATPGSVIPYDVELALRVNSRGSKSVDVPVTMSGDLPLPLVPEVAIQSIQWEELSLSKASALIALHVWNRNEFPIDLSQISYLLTLSNIPVARSFLKELSTLPPGEEKDIELRTSFSPQSLGLAFINVLRGSGAAYELAGTMRLSTPFGAMNAPYKKTGDTIFKGVIPGALDATNETAAPELNQ